MKYLFICSPPDKSQKQNKIVPVDDEMMIAYFNGKAYLAIGDRLIIDVDSHNETALIPFLADAFNKCDVVTVKLTSEPNTPATPIVKRGLEP